MYTIYCYLLNFFLPLLLFAHLANAQEPFLPGNKHVVATIISDTEIIQPAVSEHDRSARLGVHFKMDPGWHIYWENSGDSGTPTTVHWTAPQGWSLSPVRYPLPLLISEKGEIDTFGYTDETLLVSDLMAPSVVPLGEEEIEIRAEVSWLVCKDICLPGGTSLSRKLKVSSNSPLEPSSHFQKFSKYDSLTPQPATVLGALPQTKNVRISAFLSTTELAPGANAELALQISNLYSPDTLSAGGLLQIFPYAQKEIELELASVAILGTSRCGLINCHDYLVTIPLRVLPYATIGPVELRGVLALSPEALTTDRRSTQNPLSIEWSLSTLISPSTPTVTPQYKLLAASASQVRRLSYRTYLPEDKSSLDSGTPSSSGLLTILLFAFTAGLILNLMPCVLPIISIKVLGFIGQASLPRPQVIASALAFAAGILFSMNILALVVIVLRDLGHLVGWGFQFQQPAFVLVLAIVVFILSLGFFDLLTIQLPGMRKANKFVSGLTTSGLSHFFDGVLATALSTPCTAPFLGTALAFAFTQPWWITILIFNTIGVGLALPYAAISTQPALIRLLPKPGAWMTRFRQVMGFFLLGTVIWLLFILHRQTEEGVVWSLVFFLILFFAIWVNSWLIESSKSSQAKVAIRTALIFALAVLWSGLWPMISTPRAATDINLSGVVSWRPFSEEKLREAKLASQAVFIDFTADWCVTCKVNETLVLNTKDFASLLAEYHVLPIKADWTRGEEDVTTALKRYQGQGVPHYVLLVPNKDPVIFPSILTRSMLRERFAEVLGP